MTLPQHACPRCNGSGRTTDHEELGRQLRQQRETAHVGCREMARRMKIKWERGMEPWPAKRIVQFIAALKT